MVGLAAHFNVFPFVFAQHHVKMHSFLVQVLLPSGKCKSRQPFPFHVFLFLYSWLISLASLLGSGRKVPEVKFWSTPSNITYGGSIFGHVGAMSTGVLAVNVLKLRCAFHLWIRRRSLMVYFVWQFSVCCDPNLNFWFLWHLTSPWFFNNEYLWIHTIHIIHMIDLM